MLRRRLLFALATSATFERVAPKRRAWRSARRYVAGETLGEAIQTVRRLRAAGLRASVDLFGERTEASDARAVADAYLALCEALVPEPEAWISLDLSHIAFDARLLDRIAAAVPAGRRLQVGAERRPSPTGSSTPSSRRRATAAPSRPRCRPTSAARPPTPSGWRAPACPSGS